MVGCTPAPPLPADAPLDAVELAAVGELAETELDADAELDAGVCAVVALSEQQQAASKSPAATSDRLRSPIPALARPSARLLAPRGLMVTLGVPTIVPALRPLDLADAIHTFGRSAFLYCPRPRHVMFGCIAAAVRFRVSQHRVGRLSLHGS